MVLRWRPEDPTAGSQLCLTVRRARGDEDEAWRGPATNGWRSKNSHGAGVQSDGLGKECLSPVSAANALTSEVSPASRVPEGRVWGTVRQPQAWWAGLCIGPGLSSLLLCSHITTKLAVESHAHWSPVSRGKEGGRSVAGPSAVWGKICFGAQVVPAL